MKILSINTSHGICSVALAEDGVLIAIKTDNEASKQAEILFLIINTMLQENNLSYADIGAIAVDIGPGSFTGVRIGLASARGITLAAKIPVIGVTGFEALAYAAKNDATYENLLVVLDARRGQVFAQFFSKDGASTEMLLDYESMAGFIKQHTDITIIGDGANLIEPLLQNTKISYSIIDEFKLPDAAMTVFKAFEKISSGNYGKNPTPLYIRTPDAKLPKSAVGL